MSQQLKKQSGEFRKFFLLEFTKELIKNSTGSLSGPEVEKKKGINPVYETKKEEGFKKITERDEQDKAEKQEKVHDLKRQQEEFEKSIKSKEDIARPLPPIRKPERMPVLRIPKQNLPKRLQYLRPMPNKKQIELGKLNPLIADPMIRIIECNGSDTEIIVKGRIGIKKTGITLSKEEIEGVIKNFSEATKIPVYEGVFKVAFGSLILSSIVSKDIGNKFIIKKIPPLHPVSRTHP